MWKIICAYVLLITCSFVNGDPKVPCYFIFGDSLSDAGNNNNLVTNATANFPPYGVDFPGGVATGRFTNGLTSVDIITKLVEIDGLISPFSTASGRDILKGVNYASGGSGILSESGSHLGDRIWLARQVQNHAITISKLQSMVDGPRSVNKYLNKCLYTMNIGSNDYINNYFMPKFYSSMKNFTHEQFATILVTEYEQQIKALYDYGARKTAIFGIGLIGCTPAEMRIHNAIFCVDEINDAVGILNKKLLELVKSLNKKLAGAKFTFIDISGVQNASPFAIGPLADMTCCELRSDYQCKPNVRPCRFRDLYAFMDGFHPTEIVHKLTAKLAFNSPLRLFVNPVDIKTLISFNTASEI
ncbi:GDSL esterase/lipase At1g29660-like [Silene latifolia]|uniref:GDSL esterase/lipase At1g29660-like n=1 Tax=Silene latifolia TaxID=37657 RepID=UPI003D7727AA